MYFMHSGGQIQYAQLFSNVDRKYATTGAMEACCILLLVVLSANRNIIHNKLDDHVINNTSVDGISTMLQFILCFALCNSRFNSR